MRDRVRVPAVAGVALAVLAWFDLGFLNLRSPTGQVLLAEAALLAGVAWLADRQARAGRPGVAAGLGVLAGAVSVLVTRFVADTVPQRQPGTVALLALLLIVAALCRRLPGRLLVLVVVPLFAVVYLGERLPTELSSAPVGDTYSWLALVGFAFAGWGFAHRTEDGRRAAALEQVRQAERLELARDLHDHVAHHVTAMIVVAQAGAQLAERDPAQAARLFGDLERTGQDGLVAMSRMVRLLRSAGGPPEQPAPRTLDSVRDLVDRFAGGDTRAELHLGADVDEGSWSPELAKAVQRLVQEGLTNVRKHARTATTVHVSIEHAGDRLVVKVRDDGARRGRTRFRPSGFGPSGFGMVGLAERVSALGGELSGGPCDGGGWQLTASLPAKAEVGTWG
jgi:signal transduction histidine kinase